jgi:hypothetical protein
MQEVPVLQALLQFVRFGLPWDFGRTITIAHGDGRAVMSPPLSSPVFQRQQWSHEKLRRTGSRSEPGDDTANEKRRANSVQLRRSLPVQAGRAYEETYGGKLDCGHLSRRPPAAALRMRDEYAATSTQMDAAEPHPEEAANQSSRRTRRSLKSSLRLHLR